MSEATEGKETNAEYHADLTHNSHTMLEVYRKSPALFEAIYVSETLPRPPSTPAMVMGSLLHCMVLEPETINDVFYIADCKTRQGKVWQGAVEFASDTGQEPVPLPWVDEAKQMAAAVHEHPLAARLLALDGINEQPIRWTNDEGIPLKCKPDRLITDGSLDCILCPDWKSSITPRLEEFAKQAFNFGYHRQAAHYQDGCQSKHDRPVKPLYIVAGKDQPHDVFVYQPDDEYMELGHYENTVTLAALDNSRKRDVWFAENQNELQTLKLPYWARRKSE